ncbi:MAG: cytidylate kinase [Methanomassiliicoccales archaeon PtaU1.Bin124]|nr:MAG: cytidylate kinase [Methanomassiliicoccales archaeon PtaU1.Bin124]
MIVTISGPIGSGKTTVCNLLSSRLNVPCVVSGHIFRQMAKELKMSLAEFGRLAERDPKYDHELDERMVNIAREGKDIVLEGRLTAYMLQRHGIDAVKVYLDAPVDVRVRRVVERECQDLDTARDELLEREECEATRYRQYYGIDIRDKSVYDLIIDTGALRPEEVVERIVEAVRERYG